MDIIAAHQQGLLEQLEAEVADLAGRPQDQGQRAIVLHHLFDHSRGAHRWALAEARQSLRIAARFQKLERRVARWTWRKGDQEQARQALCQLAEAIGKATQARAAVSYRAYRITATAALHAVAEGQLPEDLCSQLLQCHSNRREVVNSSVSAAIALTEENERWARLAVDAAALDGAWAAVRSSRVGRIAERLLGERALAKAAERDAKRDAAKLEAEVRYHRLLPAAFAANPAQHFYSLQLALSNRRRQQWRAACDAEVSVALAA